MTTLIDEVARAMHPYSSGHKDWPDWDACADWWKDQKRREARAAIAVFARYLREPSAALLSELEYDPHVYTQPMTQLLRALASHLEKDAGL